MFDQGDNTRPRIVPDVPNYVPSAATQSQDQVDPMELVRQLLTPPQQVVQPPSTMDRIGQIIQAIAQGGSVGLSQDPGRALQSQIQGQQQMKFQADQAQKDRDEKLALLNRQFGLQVLGNQLGEQQQIRSENRAEVRGDKTRQENMDDFIKKNKIEFNSNTARDAKQLEGHKALAILQHQWDVEKQNTTEGQFWYQQDRLENKDRFDKTMSLIVGGVPAGLANTIGSKIFTGEDLSPSEASAVSAAATRAMAAQIRAVRAGRSGSGVSSGLTDKQANQYIQARMKDDFIVINVPVTGADGQPQIDPQTNKPVTQQMVVEKSNAPKDPVTGEIQGFQRVANQGEKMIKIADEANAVEALKTPQGRATIKGTGNSGISSVFNNTASNPTAAGVKMDSGNEASYLNVPTQGGEQQLKMQHYSQWAQQNLQSGYSIAQTIVGLQNTAQAHPEDADFINAVIQGLQIRSTTRKIGKK
jgi:hypothetical protein